MKGIGLVFSGGGGKGAYQIGVWKYLHQYGLDQFVRAVSGTSVGALNAALFASGDVQRAEDLWLNIEPEQILTPRKITWNEIAAWVGGTALLNGPIGVTGKLASTAATATASAFASGFLAMLGRRYAFSRDGLMELIQQGVDFSIIQNSPIPCYATCLSVGPTPGVRRFDLRRYNSEDSQKLLLASSAIPIIFDAVEFEGSHYYDGGVPMVGDNIPIQPVYETGVEYILVVHLSQDSPVDRICYPNARLLEVIPQRDLGGPIDGTLDFTASGAKWRMEQGWKDMEKILSPFVEQAVLWKKNELLLQAFLRSEQEYQVQVQELQRQKEAIQQERETNAVLVAVKPNAFTKEAYGTITTVMERVGKDRNKVFIVGTQSDTLQSSNDYEELINGRDGWVRQLVNGRWYKSEREAKAQILTVSAYLHLCMKKWLALDEADLQDESKFSTTDYNNLENGIKKALNRRSYSLEDLRCEKSNADKVAEAFGITLLKARLDENLIRQYRKLKVQDLAADFCDYREQLLQKTREECSRRKVAFQSAKDGTDTLSKEAEKARLEKENLEEEKQHIESALEELRKFTNLKIRGLSFSKKGR